MSRTERRRLIWVDDEPVWTDSAPDSSCRRPECCGGQVSRRGRRRHRRLLNNLLRRDPEHMPTHLGFGAGDSLRDGKPILTLARVSRSTLWD